MLFTAATSPITTSDLHCRCRSQYRQCSSLLYHSFPSHHHQCSSLPLPVPPPSMILAATADPATARAPHDQKAIPLAAPSSPTTSRQLRIAAPPSLDQPTLSSLRPLAARPADDSARCAHQSPVTSRRLRSLRPPVARPAGDSARCAHQSPDQQTTPPINPPCPADDSARCAHQSHKTSGRFRSLRPPIGRPADDSSRYAY